MSKKLSQNEKIRKLRAENKQLRAKNATLCDELNSLKRDALLRAKAARISHRDNAHRAKLFLRKSFASFLVGSFKLRSLFSFYQRLVYIVRKYTLITTTLKILTFALGILQSGAIIVLFTGTMAITVPLTLLFSYTAAVLTFVFRKRLTARMKASLKDKRITVFFPPKSRAFEANSYFRGMVRDAATDADAVAVIISPFAFSPVGISMKRSFFLAARREEEGIIIMRPHYFFTFKKKILAEHDKNITFIF